MTPLIASVPPFEIRSVSNLSSTWVFHCRRVRPRRATAGIGRVGKDPMTFSARWRPSAAVFP